MLYQHKAIFFLCGIVYVWVSIEINYLQNSFDIRISTCQRQVTFYHILIQMLPTPILAANVFLWTDDINLWFHTRDCKCRNKKGQDQYLFGLVYVWISIEINYLQNSFEHQDQYLSTSSHILPHTNSNVAHSNIDC